MYERKICIKTWSKGMEKVTEKKGIHENWKELKKKKKLSAYPANICWS